MNYFRRMVNGPPCEMRKEEGKFFRFCGDNGNLNFNTENGLVEWTCDFSRAQNKSGSTEVLFQNWMTYFQSIGISLFSYHQICSDDDANSKRSSVMAHYGMPADCSNYNLLQEFSENNLLMSYAFERNELFKFSDLHHLRNRTSREENYLDSLRKLNLSEGYAVPIFKSGVCDAFFALGLGKQYPILDSRQLSMVKWACQMGHNRYVELMTKEAEQASQLGEGARLRRQKSEQISDQEAVRKVIGGLEQGNIIDHAQTQAKNKEESYRFQLVAAMQLGYREPFSKAQSQLNYALMKITASQEVSEDAWKLYHMLRQVN